MKDELIKMNQKAFFIQMEWHPQNGDLFVELAGPLERISLPTVWICGSKWCRTAVGKVWLPRQDQLQKMVNPTGPKQTCLEILTDLQVFTMLHGLEEISMDELWLRYVMMKRFNQIWNGRNWITPGTERPARPNSN